MRIACPFCGDRDSGEFTYLGDAAPVRPSVDLAEPEAGPKGGVASFHDYVYLRDNVAGPMREYWYHGGGCRSWLILTRDTRSHEILGVEPAPGCGGEVSE